jgi:homoserine O-succinyltransferase/O-acetyltransferase
MKKPRRVAVLDLNNNVQNRGIPYIRRMIEYYGDTFTYDVFDVRHKLEMPDLSYDIYISSGGPGSPFDFEGGWDKRYFDLISLIKSYNNDPSVSDKKYVFFICHSFQLACQYFKIGIIKRRVTRSFGTFPCFLTEDGDAEPLFDGLPNPFWIADFRDWQVVNADKNELEANNFKILALEKERPHVNLPRAIMGIRFTAEMMGTQFHPEADAEGMYSYFNEPERKAQVVKDYGEERYAEMLADLKDDDKINLTHKTILPNFLMAAAGQVA